MRTRRPLRDWIDGLERLGEVAQIGAEWHTGCPSCGGVDRFWVRKGSKKDVVAHCRQCAPDKGTDAHGKWIRDVEERVFGPDPRRGSGPKPRDDWSPGPVDAQEPDPPRAADPIEDGDLVKALHAPLALKWARWKVGSIAQVGALWWRSQPYGGDLVCPLLTPGEWESGATSPPFVCEHRVHVGPMGKAHLKTPPDGEPRNKTTKGPFGCKRLMLIERLRPGDVVNIVEGLADALATAAAQPGPVIASNGPMTNLIWAVRWIASRWDVAQIWADPGEPGTEAAIELARLLRRTGRIDVGVNHHDKDPADLFRPYNLEQR